MNDRDDETGSGVRLDALARELGRSFAGDSAQRVRGVASLEDAGPDDLVFVRDASHLEALADSRARAVILLEGLDPGQRAAIFSSNPALDFARAVECVVSLPRPQAGVDACAVVASECEIDETASIGAGASIGARARVGARTVVHPNATLYCDVVVGEDCTIHAGVVIREKCVLGDRVILQPGAVIGGDGFGYVPDETGMLHKVPQVGRVVIGDDVEVGANTTVDRATLSATVLADRVKLDNLIQVGHNSEIGEDVVVAAQSGFSGSTKVGRGAIIMAQVGVAGHLEIGRRTFLGARSGVTKDVPDHMRIYGLPQMEQRRWHRVMAALKRLPEMLKRLRAVERQLGMRGEEKEGDGRDGS